MHTMQLVAYLGMLVSWPANSSMMFESMHNAITLDNVVNPIFEAVIDDFEWIEQYNEGSGSMLSKLRDKDIFFDSLWMNLGIFAFCFVILLFVLLFYYVLRAASIRFKCCYKLRNSLEVKLFYSVWIRYIIEGYLQITHSCFFYLAILNGF